MKYFLKVFLISMQLVVLIVCEDAFNYCSLNENVCENVTHIACGNLEAKLVQHVPFIQQAQINITTEKLSASDKALLINLINAHRNKIALGQTQLPKGANLPKTVWDDELELIAKSLAEIQSIAGESEFCFNRRNGNPVYTNVLLHNVNPRSAHEAVQDVLEYMENSSENQTSIESLREVAFLSKLGCYFGYANSLSKSETFEGGISCIIDYDMDRQVARETYNEGEPCTKCKNDLGCDSDFAGLCATA